MAKTLQPPCPVMAAAPGFHPYLTGRQLRKIRHHLFAAQLLADYDFAMRINPMYLKHPLCHVQPDCCNLHR
jgi:hypothetical protein